MKSSILIFAAFVLANTVLLSCAKQIAVSLSTNLMWNESTGYLPIFLIGSLLAVYFRNKIVKFFGA